MSLRSRGAPPSSSARPSFGTALKGLFLHVELIQPRRAAPGRGRAQRCAGADARLLGRAIRPAGAGLHDRQRARRRWLIPAFHAPIDAAYPRRPRRSAELRPRRLCREPGSAARPPEAERHRDRGHALALHGGCSPTWAGTAWGYFSIFRVTPGGGPAAAAVALAWGCFAKFAAQPRLRSVASPPGTAWGYFSNFRVTPGGSAAAAVAFAWGCFAKFAAQPASRPLGRTAARDCMGLFFEFLHDPPAPGRRQRPSPLHGVDFQIFFAGRTVSGGRRHGSSACVGP